MSAAPPSSPGADGSPRVRPCALVPSGTSRDERLSGDRRLSGDKDIRSEGQRDRDRIMYSSAWRRLGGVTQVITPLSEGMILHTRLTHSEKVAQIGRSVAETLLNDPTRHQLLLGLGGLDADVVEAASLGHDLGHPPFGHIGEETLDECAREVLKLDNGFEGNAQSLRIVTKLERRHTRYDGLDLSLATLAALAKYPWKRAATRALSLHVDGLANDSAYRRHWRKFSAYETESDELEQARNAVAAHLGTEIQSLEASVMDVADDITYAVHDLEDFFLAGIMNVRAILEVLGDRSGTWSGKLRGRLALDYDGMFDQRVFDDRLVSVADAVRRALHPDYIGSPLQQSLARERLSVMIAGLVANVELTAAPPWPGGPHITLRQDAWHDVQILKQITKTFVIERSDIALLQRGQQHVLRELVTLLMNWKDSPEDFKRLPIALRDEIEIARAQQSGDIEIGYARPRQPRRGPENRAILDYICTFTDSGCLALYETLTGHRAPRIGTVL